jgi:hypothetical protein
MTERVKSTARSGCIGMIRVEASVGGRGVDLDVVAV